MTSLETLLAQDFAPYGDMIRANARERADHVALVDGHQLCTYRDLDEHSERVAAGLQRASVRPGDVIAICAGNRASYMIAFIGALKAGAASALLPQSASASALRRMLDDSGAKVLFLDDVGRRAFADAPADTTAPVVDLDSEAFDRWLTDQPGRSTPVDVRPEFWFNIIYSSGTTGIPKGIVHAADMRWRQIINRSLHLYGPDAVSIASTPLYSNTTLVSTLPTLALGGTVVIMRKFEVDAFLDLAQRWRATHAMLVPAQYRRILGHPDFDRTDLSSFVMKFSTSAPLSAEMKADILRRWPGGLIEYYGMTEGGGTCVLEAHAHPDKLHTVGRPAVGHDIRVVDDDGREVPTGTIGEIVGHSATMMVGYHNNVEATAQTVWRHPDGRRFIKTGDIGRFDDDGFLTLMDRKKDMIISGGFNVYPSDLEAVLVEHPGVLEAAVVAVASDRWGETPAAFVTAKAGAALDADDVLAFANARLGKLQRIARVVVIDTLPRSAIGKVLKRELRDRFATAFGVLE